ncbi:HNH endonuclease [Metaclostridioides mangenotii]|uniref:HNH endonuclease n=1 Tax=Metaclostridioides mangenotii TaxID=1540 RepID=UPI0004824418
MNLNNEPYLDVHHIIWLSKGGNDDIDNTVALCPNCHKKMHIFNLDKDIEHLSNLNKQIIHT